MFTAILQRDYRANPNVTFGKLYLPWLKVQPDIYTIEPIWKDNQSNISCIPEGIYQCVPHNTDKHPDTWELEVKNRTSILIHPGNFASLVKLQGNQIHSSDTQGCILVGFGIEENIPMITRSKEAMYYLQITLGIKTIFGLEIKE